jgi:hypothetical protein
VLGLVLGLVRALESVELALVVDVGLVFRSAR